MGWNCNHHTSPSNSSPTCPRSFFSPSRIFNIVTFLFLFLFFGGFFFLQSVAPHSAVPLFFLFWKERHFVGVTSCLKGPRGGRSNIPSTLGANGWANTNNTLHSCVCVCVCLYICERQILSSTSVSLSPPSPNPSSQRPPLSPDHLDVVRWRRVELLESGALLSSFSLSSSSIHPLAAPPPPNLPDVPSVLCIANEAFPC